MNPPRSCWCIYARFYHIYESFNAAQRTRTDHGFILLYQRFLLLVGGWGYVYDITQRRIQLNTQRNRQWNNAYLWTFPMAWLCTVKHFPYHPFLDHGPLPMVQYYGLYHRADDDEDCFPRYYTKYLNFWHHSSWSITPKKVLISSTIDNVHFLKSRWK